MPPEDFADLLRTKLADSVHITGQTKEDVIVRLNEGVYRTDTFTRTV